MKAYLNILKKILNEGKDRSDRTGTGTRSIFGCQMRFNLQDGFPLVTTKKVHFKSVAHELLWFLKGESNIQYLKENGVSIWDEWANENGELGPVYGVQWRAWPAPDGKKIDQIKNLLETLKSEPHSRRMVISAWNPAQLDLMALSPCHCLFQFYVADNTLSCQLYQRSADIFLGVPFNIASYALLTEMIAQVCNMKVGDLVITLGDAHLYMDHFEQAKEQLGRSPKKLPKISFNKNVTDLFEFKYDDFELIDYDPHPLIKAKVSV